MMSILKDIINCKKQIKVNKLPSMGLFYEDNFTLNIKRATESEIKEYEENYDSESLGKIINSIKKIVCNNTFFNKNYTYYDIKSVDIVFVFLEIVKFTINKPIKITYIDDFSPIPFSVEFSSEYFNYMDINSDLKKLYNKPSKEFIIDGFRFSLPSVGIDDSISEFLFEKMDNDDYSEYVDKSYDFMFFIGNKNKLTFDEIENLIKIFNNDLEKDDIDKIKKIILKFKEMQKYSLIHQKRIIDINQKIDLKNIWK
jgi:hypothetical protein